MTVSPARHNLARVLARFIKDEKVTGALGMATRDAIGGQRFRTLMEWCLYPTANGQCVCCRQDVVLGGNAMAANAATAGTLIPCAMVNDINTRGGYLPGNCALFCRACVDASNDAAKAGRYFVWTADIIDASRVPLAWPSLPKTKPHPYPPIPSVDLNAYRMRAAHRRAMRGIVA